MLGCSVGFIGGSTNWPLWFNINFPPYLTILIAIHVPLTAYAIIKHHLLDINIALTRAGIFIFVYLFVLGIPFILGYRYGLWRVATWFMLFLATLGPFIYTYLRRRAEDIILKDQRRYQQALIELSKNMGRIRDLDKLLRTIVLTVVDTVKASFAAIYLKSDEHKNYQLRHCFPKEARPRFQEFVSLDYSLVQLLNQRKRPLLYEEIGQLDKVELGQGLAIPCFFEDGLLGFLVLGPKPNNRMYAQDDMLIFETLSYATALAIENSQFWKEIEERQRHARVREMNLFSYSLAHEIDNPMAIIIGHAELLKKFFIRENLGPEKQKDAETDLDHILEAARRVSRMVDAIQDLGQRTPGEFSPVSLKDAVTEFLNLYGPIFKFEKAYFTMELPQAPLFVRGIKAELIEILIIFANNSLHALKGCTEEKNRIHLKITAGDSGWARIAFSDNGYGIAQEKIEAIFAPFVTTKASTEGTGMGLYNAKKIVGRHQGRIWAESAGAGKGATFLVELPIANVTEEELKQKDSLKAKGRLVFGFEDGG
jgi:signal transduction histidine kinase